VLVLNLVTNLLLFYAELKGNKLITSNLSAGTYLFLYCQLLGSSCCGGLYLSQMYAKVTSKNNNFMSKGLNSNSTWVGAIAVSGILIDILTGLVLVYGPSKLRLTLGFLLSFLLACFQVAVTVYQIKQTRTMVQLLHSNNMSNGSIHVLELERKLRRCVKISIASSLYNTVVGSIHRVW